MPSNQPLLEEIRETLKGSSPETKRINRAIKKFSKVENNVIIMGDIGTGKEFLARQIHAHSNRQDKPFVIINCAAFGYSLDRRDLLGQESEHSGSIKRTIGLLEKTNNGTVYLENLSDLTSEYQVEFLQAIQAQKVKRIGGFRKIDLNVRYISSLKTDLKSELESGAFRKELYFQLKSLTITIPPLRQRKQDIPELFIYFLKQYCAENELEIPAVPAEIFESILEYDWKGNVRELKNCVGNLVMMSPYDELATEFLPFEIKRDPLAFLELGNLKKVISEVESYLINKALKRFSGNQVKAAKLLGVPEATLRFKMKKHAIPKD